MFTECKTESRVVLNGQSGTFSSPNFPNVYENFTCYDWHITVQSNYLIQLTFGNFSLEYQGSCQYDWVDIMEGTTFLDKCVQTGDTLLSRGKLSYFPQGPFSRGGSRIPENGPEEKFLSHLGRTV